ncbi:MAG: tRNA nucleotidyltransferase [Bacillales bacterium]|jgi:tRNA nucleotidyltransferase (CCA-adding enzyme)|nr:tRNA nucleotidyltransferase [Bacillales bacterium]
MQMSLFNIGKEVIQVLKKNNHKAYFVGGCVRDYLLNRKVNDIDIATSATPDEIIEIFPRTVPIGLKHGTVLILHNDIGIEITTFRSEGNYSDNRHPSNVEFIKSLEKDLSRRDFTINAIAMDEIFNITDPFNGHNDLINKTIRTVGNPDERFSEDALRIMRALRFMSQLDFTIEYKTFNSLVKNSYLLKNIAIERIVSEFEKLILGENAVESLNAFFENNIHTHLPNIVLNNCKATKKFTKLNTLEERWAYLMISGNYETPKEVLKLLKLPNNKIKQIEILTSGFYKIINHNLNEKFIYEYGLNNTLSINKLNFAINNTGVSDEFINKMYECMPIKSRNDLCIDGHSLVDTVGIKKGIWVKELLEEIELLVLNGTIENDMHEIQEWIKTCKLQQYKN